LETSLIGKALAFGPKECGFESRVSNLYSNGAYAYVIAHLNMGSSQKRAFTLVSRSRKTTALLAVLQKIGVLQHFRVFLKIARVLFQVYLSYYKKQPVTKNLKLISRSGCNLYISYSALRILNKRTRTSTYIISTSRCGLTTDKNALKEHSGGLVVGFFFN
jgi:ribosomal protein S8